MLNYITKCMFFFLYTTTTLSVVYITSILLVEYGCQLVLNILYNSRPLTNYNTSDA